MKISIFCQFEENGACGIHMLGKALGLLKLNHSVHLVHHPFKYDVKKSNSFRVEPNFKFSLIYSGFFGKGTSALIKLFLVLPLFLFDVPRIFIRLYQSEVVFLHKPLPLAFFYLALLKISFYRGKILCILDDWEGVGGMATVRQADNLLFKMLATFSDEGLPPVCDGIICSSQMSMEKMALGSKTKYKCIYIPLGASSIPTDISPLINEEFYIGYLGTFKSWHLIDFLLKIMQATYKINPKIKFLILGGGEEFEYLQESVNESDFKECIVLTGQIDHALVDDELKKENLNH